MPATHMLRIAQALRRAGLDRWTVAESQDCPLLMTVETSASPGRVWLRPHFTPVFAQLELEAGQAVEAIERFAHDRLDAHARAGAEPPRFATEDEALQLWDRLYVVAEALPREAA